MFSISIINLEIKLTIDHLTPVCVNSIHRLPLKKKVVFELSCSIMKMCILKIFLELIRLKVVKQTQNYQIQDNWNFTWFLWLFIWQISSGKLPKMPPEPNYKLHGEYCTLYMSMGAIKSEIYNWECPLDAV